jgi:hypothetical protein
MLKIIFLSLALTSPDSLSECIRTAINQYQGYCESFFAREAENCYDAVCRNLHISAYRDCTNIGSYIGIDMVSMAMEEECGNTK